MNTQKLSQKKVRPTQFIQAKSVINFKSGFAQKLLCDGLTFSLGDACVYQCAFCYTPAMMARSTKINDVLKEGKLKFQETTIRRENAIQVLENQLLGAKTRKAIYLHPDDIRVIYASPLVDVAPNIELVRETIKACLLILEHTNWQIRLLSKSNLLPKVAKVLGTKFDAHKRLIYGVSTGTLNDDLAKTFEKGTALPSKRIDSLHWLQDQGLRTFGMICPSLPKPDYGSFSKDMMSAIQAEKCEHVWAEVINLRGQSLVQTVQALQNGGFSKEAANLEEVFKSNKNWENYSRKTFEAHTEHCPPNKLRFLQYITEETKDWWKNQESKGAILLGQAAHA